jgi:hypothetical protein
MVVWDKQSGDEVKRLPRETTFFTGVTIHPGNPLEFVSFGADRFFIVHVHCVVFTCLAGTRARLS